MDLARLRELFSRFDNLEIAVLGDFFLDKYLDTDPSLAEPSVETGKTAHQVTRVRLSPGVAGTVVNNLDSLGARRIHAVGAVGDDGEGYDLRRELAKRNCSTEFLIRSPELMTPQYLKPRNQSDPTLAGELERFDTKNRRPTPDAVIRELLQNFTDLLPRVQGVIIADQIVEENLGIVTQSVRDTLGNLALQYSKTIFWADSRAHIDRFQNVIIKPNQFEAVGHRNPLPDEEIPAEKLIHRSQELVELTQAPVVITRGHQPVFVNNGKPVTELPAVKLAGEIDPTGCGDSFSAGAVLTLAAGGTLREAVQVGIIASSLIAEQLATTGTTTQKEIESRFLTLFPE